MYPPADARVSIDRNARALQTVPPIGRWPLPVAFILFLKPAQQFLHVGRQFLWYHRAIGALKIGPEGICFYGQHHVICLTLSVGAVARPGLRPGGAFAFPTSRISKWFRRQVSHSQVLPKYPPTSGLVVRRLAMRRGNFVAGRAFALMIDHQSISKPANPDSADRSVPTGEEWTSRLSRNKRGLAALSFAESTVVPIPLETIVVPLMVGHPRRALRIALAIWLGCIVGATLFYGVSFLLADPVVHPVLNAIGLEDDFRKISQDLSGEGFFWTIFLVSFSPVPMQLATLGAGTVGGNPVVFIAAIALSRGLRYFGLAILAQLVGERIAHLDIPKRWLVLGLGVLLVVGWGVMQLL